MLLYSSPNLLLVGQSVQFSNTNLRSLAIFIRTFSKRQRRLFTFYKGRQPAGKPIAEVRGILTWSPLPSLPLGPQAGTNWNNSPLCPPPHHSIVRGICHPLHILDHVSVTLLPGYRAVTVISCKVSIITWLQVTVVFFQVPDIAWLQDSYSGILLSVSYNIVWLQAVTVVSCQVSIIAKLQDSYSGILPSVGYNIAWLQVARDNGILAKRQLQYSLVTALTLVNCQVSVKILSGYRAVTIVSCQTSVGVLSSYKTFTIGPVAKG
jgi:hypothetical protein